MQDQSGVCLSADSNCRPPHTNVGGGWTGAGEREGGLLVDRGGDGDWWWE